MDVGAGPDRSGEAPGVLKSEQEGVIDLRKWQCEGVLSTVQNYLDGSKHSFPMDGDSLDRWRDSSCTVLELFWQDVESHSRCLSNMVMSSRCR